MFKGFTRLLHSPGEHLKSLLDSPESASDALSPRIIPRSEHPVSRQQISEAALKVLYRLNGAGFDAYLVGGCIRDALLGKVVRNHGNLGCPRLLTRGGGREEATHRKSRHGCRCRHRCGGEAHGEGIRKGIQKYFDIKNDPF